jgi:hypothetical protein
MLNEIKTAVLMAVFIVCSATYVAAEQGSISEEYPGIGNEIIIRLSDTLVTQGLRCYYRAHGNFPEKWSDVKDSGISTVILVGYQMQEINPDDPSLDFPGDVYYENNRGTAFVHVLNLDGHPERIRVHFPSTYVKTLQGMTEILELSTDQHARMNEISKDNRQLLQYAMLGNMTRSMEIFRSIYNRYPADLQEFFQSGISPVTYNTINPITGSSFKFDGTPGDVFIDLRDSMIIVTSVDEKGIELPHFNYYF